MPTLIATASRINAAGTPPKLIDEYFGHVNSGHESVSIARMRSPAGWCEPGQTPKFSEFSIVLSGVLRVEHSGGVLDVPAGQAVAADAGEWVRYSTPEGADYIAVCLPAFSLAAARRDSV
ncbi:MAG: cupin domain-containing protein [Planctomycetes bacterium]|nr:cupin domain-containing protein [Planctomycetota bacterium]